QDTSVQWFIKTNQEAADGGLARSHSPDDADPLARRNAEGNFFERVFRSVWIAKCHVLEGNATLLDAPRDVNSVRWPLALESHNAIDRLERGEGLRRPRDHGGNTRYRRTHAPAQQGRRVARAYRE